MDEREAPEVVQAITKVLRALHGGSQAEHAAASGVSRATISRCERGHAATRKTLERLAAGADVTPPELDAFLDLVRPIVGRRAGLVLPEQRPRKPEATASPLVGAAAGLALAVARLEERRRAPLALPPSGWRPAAPTAADRLGAPDLWARLAPCSQKDRLFLVEEVDEYQSWALAELVAGESLRLTAEDVDQAVELAELAVAIAELVPGDERWWKRNQGYCWQHLGNARRARNDLAGAEAAFATGRPLWQEGAGGDPGLLSEARVLGLEVSLHRDQRRFAQALELLAAAFEADRGEERSYLLINQAKTLEAMGDLESAVGILRQVEPLLDPEREPRLAFIARSNLVYLLSHLEHHVEAERKLAEAERLAEGAAKALDRLRLLWVRGRVTAGLGKQEEGRALLDQVRQEFAARDMPYDRALVSLELAQLHLERGRSREVQVLVREMFPVFRSQEIHREAMAALILFRKAVEQERATAELARRLVDYLHRARHNPDLRFTA